MTTETQSQQILAHLKAGRSITPIDALERFQCFRLGARIYEVRSRKAFRAYVALKAKAEKYFKKAGL